MFERVEQRVGRRWRFVSIAPEDLGQAKEMRMGKINDCFHKLSFTRRTVESRVGLSS